LLGFWRFHSAEWRLQKGLYAFVYRKYRIQGGASPMSDISARCVGRAALAACGMALWALGVMRAGICGLRHDQINTCAGF